MIDYREYFFLFYLTDLHMFQTNPCENNVRNQKRYRPIQALNNRKVEKYWSAYYATSSFISVGIPVNTLIKLAL